MKKIVILTICLLLSISLCGCSSTTDTQAFEKLNTELDNVSSIVSSTNTSEVAEVSSYLSNNSSSHISLVRENAYYNMTDEDQLRQAVLELNSILKSSTRNKYKLGQKNASAIVELANTLKSNTAKLSDTKKDVKTYVNRIKRFSNVNTINYPQMMSAYNALNSLMNERQTYLINIYATLQEIDNILSENLVQTTDNQNDVNTLDENATQYPNSTSQNIYYDYSNSNYSENDSINQSLINNNQSNTRNNNQNLQTSKRSNKSNNIDTYKNGKTNNQESNTTINQSGVNENTNYQYSNTQYGNNGYNNYNNGYNNLGYGNGAYNRNGRINPNRNTDTFYPTRSNIDTYRYRPNFNTYNYGYNNLNRYNGYNSNNTYYNDYNNNAVVASDINNRILEDEKYNNEMQNVKSQNNTRENNRVINNQTNKNRTIIKDDNNLATYNKNQSISNLNQNSNYNFNQNQQEEANFQNTDKIDIRENQKQSQTNTLMNDGRKEDMLREKGINKIKSDRTGKIVQSETSKKDKTDKMNTSYKKDNIKLQEIGTAKISNSFKDSKEERINPLNIHQSYNNILRFDNVTKRPITEDQPKIARDNKISKVERS